MLNSNVTSWCENFKFYVSKNYLLIKNILKLTRNYNIINFLKKFNLIITYNSIVSLISNVNTFHNEVDWIIIHFIIIIIIIIIINFSYLVFFFKNLLLECMPLLSMSVCPRMDAQWPMQAYQFSKEKLNKAIFSSWSQRLDYTNRKWHGILA